MKALALVIGCGLLLAGSAAAQDKNELKKLIVGKWETIHKGPDNSEIKINAEFTADGKIKIEIKEIKIDGTYSVIGDGQLETETNFQGTTRKVKQEVKISQDTNTMEMKEPNGPLTRFTRKK